MKIKTVTMGTLIMTLMMTALVGCGATEVIASETVDNIEGTMQSTDTEDVSDESEDLAAKEMTQENAENLDDSQFVYNGNVVSVMDSFEAIDKALGGYKSAYSYDSYYKYGKDDGQDFGLEAYEVDGDLLPVYLSTQKDIITTSRNIKVGSTKEEVLEAYGDPNVERDKAYGPDGKELTDEEFIEIIGEFLTYDFGDFQICFSIENGKVTRIGYQNDVNHDKLSWS